MDRAPVYTFIGIRPDGVSVAKLATCLDLTQAQFKARLWVRDRAGCTAVQVWKDDKLLWRETISDVADEAV